MEIKAGELVRTNKGKIFKVTEVNQTLGKEIAIVKNEYGYPRRIDLTEEKHSFNIIDLIEVGDIVFIQDVLNNDFVYIYDDEMLKAVREDIEKGLQITTILTHEQYKQNCYTVERRKQC